MSEYAWVIEGAWSPIHTPDYWVGSSTWSQDHNIALRFARKLDAEQAAATMLDGVNVRICEHVWPVSHDEAMQAPSVLLADRDRLAAELSAERAERNKLQDICRRLIDADAKGVVISSDKTGTWNIMQELKREIGAALSAGGPQS